MVMTIHKLTAGDGYTYLTRQVAGGDVERAPGQSAADYYAAQGNPPGVWIGTGAHLLGLTGKTVTEAQMRTLYGQGLHPDAEAAIAAFLAEHVSANTTPDQLSALTEQARRQAALGKPFPTYQPLAPFDERVARRLAVIAQQTERAPTSAEIRKVHREEARRQRAAVAGFDVVLAPVKSADLLWALDPRSWVREAVNAAHVESRDAAFALLQKHAALTRVGTGGVAQIEAHGLIAASFDHYDSRAGDPNLHTHIAISNKVQGIDGKWRSLDARALYRMTVAASEYYNTAFETALSRRLGVTFAARPDTPRGKEPVREIVGIPLEFIDHFSKRRAAIEARYEQLTRAYRREHGHDPAASVCHKLARQANLDTRDGKKAPRSLAQMREDWKASLTEAFGADATLRIAAVVNEPGAAKTSSSDIDHVAIAASVVGAVAEMRATWTVWNVHAEAERQVRAAAVLASADEHHRVVEAIVAEAVSPRLSVRIDAPSLLNEPNALRRADGSSVFREHAADRYTSSLILDAEQRLLDAARTPTMPPLDRQLAEHHLEAFERVATRPLDPGQRALVAQFASNERMLLVGLGPAGSGKTTAMRALAHVLEQAGSRLIPLGASAASAAVLGADLGVQAENLHKFIWEHTSGSHAQQLRTAGAVPAEKDKLRVRPGDVVLVDEAGLAGTLNLDRLLTIARHHGAVVRLLGDHRQLSAVESGGALRLTATDVGAYELTTLYRFNNPAEAAATLHLRNGDTAGLDFYDAKGRIHGGSREAMIEAAYQAWKADMLSGRSTLMSAATNADVASLAAQARADRVEAGQVEPAGVALHDGNVAGVGDWIITRSNDRRVSVHHGRDFVKNGDGWRVLQRHVDGSLDVQHLGHQGRVRLSAEYVRTDVELLYATTSMRSQGTTVDTAHALITDTMTRENLYVTASRARSATHLYAVTHELLPLDPDDRLDRTKNDPKTYLAREVLDRVLASEGTELSATEAIRTEQADVGSLARLIPQHEYAAALATDQVHLSILERLLDPATAQTLVQSPDWRAVNSALRQGLRAGHQPEPLLTGAVRALDRRGQAESCKQLAQRIDELARTPSLDCSDGLDVPSALPWVSNVALVPRSADEDLHCYVAGSIDLINSRVGELAECAISDLPTWSSELHPAPGETPLYEQWKHHIGIVAAYREQFAVRNTDPDEPLGPAMEQGRAGHVAYTHAAASLAAARALVGARTDHSQSSSVSDQEPSIAERRRAGRASERQVRVRQRPARTARNQQVEPGANSAMELRTGLKPSQPEVLQPPQHDRGGVIPGRS